MGHDNGIHYTAEMRATIESLLARDGTTPTAVARELGLRPCTIRNMARELRERATAPERPEFEASFVPSAAMPNGDLIAHLAARSRKVREHFRAEKNRRIKINTSDPFAIVWFTDVHLGDNGADYDTLARHCELARTTPHTFGVFMGDASNNWPVNGKLGRLWADQETSKHQERQLVDWFLNESGVPWLFWALGNHDLWGDGESLLRAMNADMVPMAAWGAKLTLEFANRRECKMDLAHDHKGHSMWNPLHAETKTAQMGWSADFVFSGHRHNAALHFEEYAARNQATWLMRVKGYKEADDHSFNSGFSAQTEGHAGVTVIDPRTSRLNPIVHASIDVEEGLDYLKFLRAKR